VRIVPANRVSTQNTTIAFRLRCGLDIDRRAGREDEQEAEER
jgi:hypothetical protein